MNKTRKERITAASNKKTIEQFDQTHLVYKRGTAVLSTTLLVGLLAFPSFSVSATANDLANSSTEKLENAKEIQKQKLMKLLKLRQKNKQFKFFRKIQ